MSPPSGIGGTNDSNAGFTHLGSVNKNTPRQRMSSFADRNEWEHVPTKETNTAQMLEATPTTVIVSNTNKTPIVIAQQTNHAISQNIHTIPTKRGDG